MDTIDLTAWVEEAPSTQERNIRACFHITLLAISQSNYLSEQMVLKGGVLMAIHYDSDRYTTDLDFSHEDANFDSKNPESVEKIIDNLQQELSFSLQAASIKLSEYNLSCGIHTIKAEPNSQKVSFVTASYPSLKIIIGYADKNNQGAVNRLNNKSSSDTISIDYSFNEVVESVSEIALNNDDLAIKVYSLESLVAEKLRSILQQSERNRQRGQDIFDIYHLIKNGKLDTNDEFIKVSILHILLKKSQGRKIENLLHKDGMKDSKIKANSKIGFNDLELPLEGNENFDIMYHEVETFFQSLPWE